MVVEKSESAQGNVREQWAEWLLHRRHGGDQAELRRTLDRLSKVRDRVLDNAAVATGETLLDVGTGDGLIAFGALDRVGPGGRVILSDVSQDLVAHVRALAEQMGVVGRCEFVQAPAEDLSVVEDATVDVVTTRSVLAYVAPKQRAFEEFFRVLRPGGRISLYEPVNCHINQEPPDRWDGYDVAPVRDLASKLKVPFDQRQPPESDPMFDFDERDLVTFVEQAGFGERHLELRIDVRPQAPTRWDLYARTAPNPLAPSLEEAMAESFTPAEAKTFSAHLRPLVERGEGTFSTAVVYLWAVKS